MDWKDKHKRAFISHKAAHRKFIGHLSSALNDWLVHGFVAHDAIEVGKKWRTEILDALHTCDFMIAYLTDDWNDGAWTNQEVGIAIALGKPVVSVMAGSDPIGFMNETQGVRHGDDQKAPALAAEVLRALANTDPKIGSEVIVNGLVHSSSWDMSRDVAEAVPTMVTHATPEMVAELEAAAETSSELTGLTQHRKGLVKTAIRHLKALAAADI